MYELSDDELRSALKSFGFEAGPIIPSTRSVYERKLAKLSSNSSAAARKEQTRSKNNTKTTKLEAESAPPRTSLTSQQWTNPASVSPQELRSRSSLFYSNEPYFSTTTASPQQHPGHTPISKIEKPVLTESFGASFSADRYPESLRTRTSNGRQTQGCNPIFSTDRSTNEQLSYFSQTSPAHTGETSQSGINQLHTSPRSDSQSRSPFWLPHNNRHEQTKNTAISGVLSNDGDSTLADSFMVSKWFGFSVHSQVPNIILFCAVTLFAVVLSSYFMLKDRHGNVGRIADFQKLVCSTVPGKSEFDTENSRQFQHDCVSSKDLSPSMKVLAVLFDVLSKYAGEFRCGESAEGPRMDVDTVKKVVMSTSVGISITDHMWRNVLIIIQAFGRRYFDIAAYSADGEESTSCHSIRELESLRPYIPGKCRLRLFLMLIPSFLAKLFWVAFIVCLVCAACYLVYHSRLSRRMVMNRRESRVRELVQQVSALLQQQLQRHQSNPSELPYVPVSAIRDVLSRSNRDLAELWDDLEHYVHLVEGCIQVQEWRGLGETWQWQGGTGWQGSALLNEKQRLPFTVPPTECLKIRNMFTVDAMDYNSEKRLKRELLKRIAHCGEILHIGLDNQDNQGLMYLRCASPQVAGNVYQAIHANYFDSHLLTVKFLRLSKYIARFPDAQKSGRPLRISDI